MVKSSCPTCDHNSGPAQDQCPGEDTRKGAQKSPKSLKAQILNDLGTQQTYLLQFSEVKNQNQYRTLLGKVY